MEEPRELILGECDVLNFKGFYFHFSYFPNHLFSKDGMDDIITLMRPETNC